MLSFWQQHTVGYEDLDGTSPWIAIPLSGEVVLHDTSPRGNERIKCLGGVSGGVRVTDINRDGSKYVLSGRTEGPETLGYRVPSPGNSAQFQRGSRTLRIQCYVFQWRTIRLAFLYSKSGSTATRRQPGDELSMLSHTNNILMQAVTRAEKANERSSKQIDLTQQRGDIQYGRRGNTPSTRQAERDVRHTRRRDTDISDADVIVLFVKEISGDIDPLGYTDEQSDIILIDDDQHDDLTLAHELTHWVGYRALPRHAAPNDPSHNTIQGNIMAKGVLLDNQGNPVLDAQGNQIPLEGRRLNKRQIFRFHNIS